MKEPLKHMGMILLALLIPFFIIVNVDGKYSVSADQESTIKHSASKTGLSPLTWSNQKDNADSVSWNEKELERITDVFMDKLVQEVDEHNKAVNVQTKKELIAEFSSIATEKVAKKYVDVYYIEKEDGLYVIPTETPPWFDKTNTYKESKKEDTVIIQQTNQSDLYGSYQVEFEFRYDNGWKLTNTKHF
ncbi:hypothetical protein KO561_13280 [Radiobacillus kanasensis]|uniref:hypothetical protein n=1 Tax=Radiobacillus kanasensis TaxID=2844358 RepID=UPI001E514566|nr:hypothetical protein [Radiobacillus kanasensis]UFT98171.1 hypothetical protein KO561_13280 [Radiobacillus kanasensis]